MLRSILFICLAISASALSATVASDARAQHAGPPPPEALKACRTKVSGEACSFQGRGRQIAGTCFAPASRPLACRPDRLAAITGGTPEPGPRPLRVHTAISVALPLYTIPATQEAPSQSVFATEIQGTMRVLQGNAIPDHPVGQFPNAGNPNRIRPQRYTATIPATPRFGGTTPSWQRVFGVGLNGVPFDPGAAEFYRGNPSLGWQYEPLGGAIAMGLDDNHAHVQPNGAYHYHGLPTHLLKDLGVRPGRHSPLVGWAADGHPIYALYGYSDPADPGSKVIEIRSGYRLKEGGRPNGARDPGGRYDGTFIQDYEYSGGALDDCNGRWTKTPEFPGGTYAYFLTDNWPVIPRCFHGVVSANFLPKRR